MLYKTNLVPTARRGFPMASDQGTKACCFLIHHSLSLALWARRVGNEHPWSTVANVTSIKRSGTAIPCPFYEIGSTVKSRRAFDLHKFDNPLPLLQTSGFVFSIKLCLALGSPRAKKREGVALKELFSSCLKSKFKYCWTILDFEGGFPKNQEIKRERGIRGMCLLYPQRLGLRNWF